MNRTCFKTGILPTETCFTTIFQWTYFSTAASHWAGAHKMSSEGKLLSWQNFQIYRDHHFAFNKCS